MIKLSERLQTLADFIEIGESMADIGTDHGFLPIYLWENSTSSKVILSDINTGPLEKARANIESYNKALETEKLKKFSEKEIAKNYNRESEKELDEKDLKRNESVEINSNETWKQGIRPIIPDKEHFILRNGSGIETVKAGEVDDIVIAGMGGNLIIDILTVDMEKTQSFQKLILQPRNAPDKLRKWLVENGFFIEDEVLAREGEYIWEVILAVPKWRAARSEDDSENLSACVSATLEEKLRYEISPILIKKKDPLLKEFIKRKLAVEEKITKNLKKSRNEEEKMKKLYALKERKACFEYILDRIESIELK